MSTLMLSVSGCRGVVGESLTPEVAARFAWAWGSWLKDQAVNAPVTVVLGRDGRRGGDEVQRHALRGLHAAGCNVVDLGIAMTPTVAVMTDENARSAGNAIVGGMVITASHNPQEWNGLKCLFAGDAGLHGAAACAPPAAVAAAVIERFRGVEVPPVGPENGAIAGAGGVTASAEVHIARVLGALKDAGIALEPARVGAGMRVAVDCVNASASRTAPAFLRALGCEVVEVNCETSGDRAGVFPHAPEPTEENLAGHGGLCDVVREKKCDVGFALDPDADRLALIDEKGRYIGEEYTLALSAMGILGGTRVATERPVMVTNLSTSRMLNDVAARFGATVLRTPVGEANVVEVMKREGAVAGGEGNGGIIWPRSCYVRDSLAGMGLVVSLLNAARGNAERSLSGLAASIPSYAIEKRKVSLTRREDAAQACEKIVRAYASQGQHTDTRDGAWVDFRSGPLAGKAWLHVRASNTEPIMRLIAEAPTAVQAATVLDDAARVIAD